MTPRFVSFEEAYPPGPAVGGDTMPPWEPGPDDKGTPEHLQEPDEQYRQEERAVEAMSTRPTLKPHIVERQRCQRILRAEAEVARASRWPALGELINELANDLDRE